MASALWIGGFVVIALLGFGFVLLLTMQSGRGREARFPEVGEPKAQASGIAAPIQTGLPAAAPEIARPMPKASQPASSVAASSARQSRPYRGGSIQIESRLGSGTHGPSFLAKEESRRQRMVVKRVKNPDPGVRELIESAAHVHNNHLSHVVHTEPLGNELVAVREHIAGYDCLQHSQNPLSPHTAGHILVEVLDALQSLHDEGAVHGDLKPTNVIIDRHGEAHVVDAGLVDYADIRALLHSHDTKQRLLLAEPLPPERIRGGPARPPGDIYAAGALLYRLLTGESHLPPGDGGIEDIRSSILDRRLRLPHHNVPPGYDSIIRRALSRRPEQRYRKASDMARALQRAALQ